MLISLGHGDRITAPAATELAAVAPMRESGTVPLAVAAPGSAPHQAAAAASDDTAESTQVFGYLFPDAGTFPETDKAAALDALAAAMAEPSDDVGGNAAIAPVMTYFGQFIDHDITANTNSEAVTAALRIGTAPIVPQNRSLVVVALKNLRKGSLGLDSVYGDGPIPGRMTDKLMAALRDGHRMRVGTVTPLGGGSRPTLHSAIPAADADGGQHADLPRVASLVGPGLPFASTAELPEGLQPGGGTNHWERRAFIGDSRNDENLIVAQFHTAVLRFHNAVLDTLGAGATFEQARQLTTWHYQWLVVNAYLPAVCDAPTLAEVVAAEAPLYRSFVDTHAASLPPGTLPMPLEFSVAAFRYGHSLVRAEYDYNANFNPEGAGPRATFQLLFQFTGNDKTQPVGLGFPTLPDNWIIDWSRFIDPNAAPGRRTRKIDTRLADPLFNMANESVDTTSLFRRLAARNLRRGHVLALPPAQALIASMTDAGFAPSGVLSPPQIESGPTGAAIRDGDFTDATPLWFYILKEAELLGGGDRLGPLGTRIVAETLVGLVVGDPASYWNRAGGRWTPADGVKPRGEPVDSMPAFLRAAGVL